ncbi:unnamed protein product [marine sediment metagenome]|uniref:Uncharacterized protein n=1 Tax=marine sediment metagenome TaxID=412755 RepID=X1QYG4_9ZZZZ
MIKDKVLIIILFENFLIFNIDWKYSISFFLKILNKKVKNKINVINISIVKNGIELKKERLKKFRRNILKSLVALI